MLLCPAVFERRSTARGHWEPPPTSPSTSRFWLLSCLIKMTASRPPPGVTLRSNSSPEGKKLFDWVLIRACQTSSDDKVHTREQWGSLLCVLFHNKLCRAKRCISQQITQACHYRGKSWLRGHRCCQNTWNMVATVMELSNPQYHSACCSPPLSRGICVSCDILPRSNETVDRNQ